MKKGLLIGLLVLVLILAAVAYLFVGSEEAEVEADPTTFDVIVVGGEPEGVAAAISAARNGAKTVLIENRDELGGLFTYGMLNFLDIPQGESGESVSQGIFKEWHALIGNSSVFDVEQAKAMFRQMVEAEGNLTLLTETDVQAVVKDGNKVTGVTIKNADGEKTLTAQSFIDATQDADFAVMAGAPYFIGGEDIGIADKKMAVTLMIHLNDVDWDGVRVAVETEKFGPAAMSDSAAWGFVELTHVYKAQEENTRLRGLNLAKIGNDYYINALQVFGVDGLDEASKQEGIARGKREIENIVKYLNAEFPGFENAKIASYPSELYVRETRHINAEYQLPMADVWANRDHWDSIGYGAYPVDIQAQTPQDYGNVVSAPKQYAIPFRSLVPKEVDGLLVVGRAAGFSSIAAGSARVVPTGMVSGEAAGAAAAQLRGTDRSFRELSGDASAIETLRQTLAAQGAFVEHIETTYPYMGEWYDEPIQALINYGLIFGRYDNDMLVDNETTLHAFTKLMYDTIYRANRTYFDANEAAMNEVREAVLAEEDIALTKDNAKSTLTAMLALSSEEALLQDERLNMALGRVADGALLQLKDVFAIGEAVMYFERK